MFPLGTGVQTFALPISSTSRPEGCHWRDWRVGLCSYSWVLSGSERWIGELVDAVLVTAAAKTRVDECGDAGLGPFNADQPRAPGDDIGVIMFARQPGRQRFRYPCAAAGGIAIDGNGDADA